MAMPAPDTVSVTCALTVFALVTNRWNLYVTARLLVLTGTVTLSVTVPFEHGVVVGNPVTVRFDEKAQLVAFVTCADKVTEPPEAPREDGATANDDTVGLAGLTEACATETEPSPARPVRVNVTPATTEAERSRVWTFPILRPEAF